MPGRAQFQFQAAEGSKDQAVEQVECYSCKYCMSVWAVYCFNVFDWYQFNGEVTGKQASQMLL